MIFVTVFGSDSFLTQALTLRKYTQETKLYNKLPGYVKEIVIRPLRRN